LTDLARHPRILAAKRRQEPDVTWRFVPRIDPGLYRAYCRSAKIYRDRAFQRWICVLQFDVLGLDGTTCLARLTWFMNLGNKDKPDASRRRKYWAAWTRANGGPPTRRDRLSPQVFCKRIAVVLVGDIAPRGGQKQGVVSDVYSVIRDVTEWETGSCESSRRRGGKGGL
jgi:hypothetical protein